MTEYENYLLEECRRFTADPARAQATVEAVSGIAVARVLDIGCGAGQEMSPLVARGAFGVGIDPTPEVGRVGRKIFSGGRVAFTRSAGEYLPFAAGCFDVIICRVALPYMDNALAISEMARVLRPDGRLLLKVHAAPYYAHKFWRGLVERNVLSSVHAGRVLAAGTLYHAARFPLWKILSNETFQTEWLLKRILARYRLEIRGYLPDHNPLTPSFLIVNNP